MAIDYKLSVILAADVCGYSDLMNRDEEATIMGLRARRAITDTTIDRFGGVIVNTAGDSVIAEFGSAADCVKCARDIQAEIQRLNDGEGKDWPMQFRIGLNVGDVIINGTDRLGEGVNIAARIEGQADPGGVMMSGSLYDQISADSAFLRELGIEALGDRKLKGISDPVRLYRVTRLDDSITHLAPVVEATDRDAHGDSAGSASLNASVPVRFAGLILEVGAVRWTVLLARKALLGRAAEETATAVAVGARFVSRLGRQSIIEYLDGAFRLVDAGSNNGTFLDDRFVSATEPLPLDASNGCQVIALGGHRDPPAKGVCQFQVERLDTELPALRLRLSQDPVRDMDRELLDRTWPTLEHDLAQRWLIAPAGATLGGRDCHIVLPGVADGPVARILPTVEGVALEPLDDTVSLDGEPATQPSLLTPDSQLVVSQATITLKSVATVA
jgi:class 3 adenylate cyclase